MSSLNLPVQEILDVIETAKTGSNEKIINEKILDFYNRNIGSESSIFFTREDNYNFIDFLKENMDEKLNADYKKYYHRFDPLDLLGKNEQIQPEIEIVKNIDYSGCEHSEYYSDFLSPQKIHYKLIISIKTGNKILSKILLTRSKDRGNFSEDDINNAREITPFIVQAVEIQKMKKEMLKNNDLLRMIEDNLKSGLILLDSSRKLIHMNIKAREICKQLRKDSFEIKNFADVNPMFLRDYLDMLGEFETKKDTNLILPRKRIFKEGASSFVVQSKFINNYNLSEHSDFILVNINETSKRTSDENTEIPSEFNLSTRESEVVNELIKGFSNSAIAQKLCISEVTVKKHLQNVFLKMSVNNRASLVQKILTGLDAD